MKIVVGGRFDYIRFAWQEAIESGEALYFTDDVFRSLTFCNKVRAKIENIISRIFKSTKDDFSAKAALREYIDIDSLKKSDEILFVIYETNFISTDFKLLGFLKRNFPKSIFVLHMTNAIGTVRERETKLLLENQNFYDLIYTFNKFDADKYGFRLFPDISGDFSSVKAADCEGFDVFFCGKAKGRLDKLLFVANKCISLGLKIRFYIIDVPEDKQIPIDGVYYNHPLSYQETLSYEKRGKAILNIMQGVSSSIALREEEAMGLDKILITDDDYIFQSGYYVEEKVIPLNNFEDQVYKIKQQRPSNIWNGQEKRTNRDAFLNRVSQDLSVISTDKGAKR